MIGDPGPMKNGNVQKSSQYSVSIVAAIEADVVDFFGRAPQK